MRQCPNCGYIGYPPVTPAILVLVHDGPRVLLAHKSGWGTMHSIIAGFVVPGESLEECVQREVKEAVGVEITDITYVSSQPWPFPHQLMVGFMARYVSGEICPDQTEIDQAAFVTYAETAVLGDAALGDVDEWVERRHHHDGDAAQDDDIAGEKAEPDHYEKAQEQDEAAELQLDSDPDTPRTPSRRPRAGFPAVVAAGDVPPPGLAQSSARPRPGSRRRSRGLPPYTRRDGVPAADCRRSAAGCPRVTGRARPRRGTSGTGPAPTSGRRRRRL